MEEFKVGDKVVYYREGGSKYFVNGETYTLVHHLPTFSSLGSIFGRDIGEPFRVMDSKGWRVKSGVMWTTYMTKKEGINSFGKIQRHEFGG